MLGLGKKTIKFKPHRSIRPKHCSVGICKPTLRKVCVQTQQTNAILREAPCRSDTQIQKSPTNTISLLSDSKPISTMLLRVSSRWSCMKSARLNVASRSARDPYAGGALAQRTFGHLPSVRWSHHFIPRNIGHSKPRLNTYLTAPMIWLSVKFDFLV